MCVSAFRLAEALHSLDLISRVMSPLPAFGLLEHRLVFTFNLDPSGDDLLL